MSENSKLTAQQQALVDQVLKNLEEGAGLWKQGWVVTGAPQSATTGKRYRGLNNFFLTLAAMREGYKDNRWATFHQIQENGWSFKTDEEGKSIAKGKSETVEFYELRDKATKKPFDRSVLDGLTKEERDDYMKENVYPLRKYYKVFNADINRRINACRSTLSERARMRSGIQFSGCICKMSRARLSWQWQPRMIRESNSWNPSKNFRKICYGRTQNFRK